MDYGICTLSLVPCRAEASDKSEMTTQLLFGDLVKIKSSKGDWLKIENDRDHYPGYVSRKQIEPIGEEQYKKLKASKFVLLDEVLAPIRDIETNEVQLITMGSRLHNYNASQNQFHIGHKKFSFEGQVRLAPKKFNRHQLVEDSMTFLNAPYLWGGKSILGMDCSGFTQLVYSMNGLAIARDAWQQAEMGQPLSFIEEAEEGDLAFFDNAEGKIIHVGIMLKGNRIIHASGKVRIDRIDHQGIYKDEIKDYSHSLRIIKKLI